MLLIAPTMRCNLRCQYCFQHLQEGSRPTAGPRKVDSGVFKRQFSLFFRYLYELYAPRGEHPPVEHIVFSLSGGEPTLLPFEDVETLYQIYVEAYKSAFGQAFAYGSRNELTTNGWEFIQRPEKMARYTSLFRKVNLSYDAHAQPTTRRGTQEQYERLIDDLIRRHGCKVSLSVTISENSIDQPIETADYLLSLLRRYPRALSRTRTSPAFNFNYSLYNERYNADSIMAFFAAYHRRILDSEDRHLFREQDSLMHHFCGSQFICNSTVTPLCLQNTEKQIRALSYQVDAFAITCPDFCNSEFTRMGTIYDFPIVLRSFKEQYFKKLNIVCSGCDVANHCGKCAKAFLHGKLAFFDGVKCKAHYRSLLDAWRRYGFDAQHHQH